MFGLSLILLLSGAIGAAAVSLHEPLELPARFEDGLIAIEATHPVTARPLVFLLDSGAATSVLDAKAAHDLAITSRGTVIVRGVRSEMLGSWAEMKGLQAGGVGLPRRWLVVPLDQLSRACARPIEGLLGADFLRKHVVQIDYHAQKVRLLPRSHPGTDATVLPLELRRGVPCVPVSVDDCRPRWTRLDTGCASPLQWVRPGAQVQQAAKSISVGLSPVAIPTSSGRVRLGPAVFHDVRIGWHAREIFPGEAGLLGNGLLSQFRVTVDLPNNRLILEDAR